MAAMVVPGANTGRAGAAATVVVAPGWAADLAGVSLPPHAPSAGARTAKPTARSRTPVFRICSAFRAPRVAERLIASVAAVAGVLPRPTLGAEAGNNLRSDGIFCDTGGQASR